ncbi:MAG: hypothetical protein V4670_03435 [Bacteroidota bacterium]
MKYTATIKNSIGLTQEEMGILLGIPKSQWSMYKSGLRDLPLTAKKQLTRILTHQQKAKQVSKESQKLSVLEKQKTQEWLQQEQIKLAYKKEVVERKLVALENKRAECFAALEVVQFLAAQNPEEPVASLLKSIELRATNTLQKHSSTQLLQLQLKKENLEMLKNSVTQKMKNNTTEL